MMMKTMISPRKPREAGSSLQEIFRLQKPASGIPVRKENE